MKKVKLYTLLFVTLVLIATPWLTTPEVKADVDNTSCCCCADITHSCCSLPVDDKEEDNSSCNCEISEIPVIPEQPIEFVDFRYIDQLDKELNHSDQTQTLKSPVKDYRYSSGISPPELPSPPLFVLFASFLI